MIQKDTLFRAMPADTDRWFILPAGAMVHLSLVYCFTCLMRRRVSNYLIFFSNNDVSLSKGPRDVVVRTGAPTKEWRLVSKTPLKELLDRSFARQMELALEEIEVGSKMVARRRRYCKSLKKMQELVDKMPEDIDEVSKHRFRIF